MGVYPRYRFAFLIHSASIKTASHGFKNWLIHCHGIPNSIASDQGNHFTTNEVQQQARAHRIHRFYYVHHHPEANGLTELWNFLLKTQCQPTVSTLQCWSKFLQKAVLGQYLICNTVYPIPRIYEPRNYGAEMKEVSQNFTSCSYDFMSFFHKYLTFKESCTSFKHTKDYCSAN